LIAGEASGGDANAIANMPSQYATIVITTIVAGLILLVLSILLIVVGYPFKKITGGVH